MLKNAHDQGYVDALAAFGLEKYAAGFFGRQLGAAKSLAANVRGGFGGKFNPAVAGEGWKPPAGFSPELGKAMHRQQAVGNLKTLAPGLAIGAAGLYGAKKLFGKSDEEKRRASMGLG